MRICSITPHQLLNNPRMVREADALAAAGHDVRVIAVENFAEQAALNADVGAGRAWRRESIDVRRDGAGRSTWLWTGIRQRAARAVWKRRRRGRWLAAAAYARTASETLRLAAAEPADLVIAHTQPMLGVASLAARRLGCQWGFDCEDILSEEYGEGLEDAAHRALVRYVEATFLPQADYVTTASPEFGPWLMQQYGIDAPTYVANVPPRGDAPASIRPGYPHERPHLSLYWVSMSLGARRGIEDAIRALPFVRVPVQLHVRARVLPAFERHLRGLIEHLGVADRVFFHDLVPPGEGVRAASAHDIGLNLMQPCCLGHELAAPNKIFTYAMAGLAIGSTATRGAASVLKAMGGASFQYAPGNHAELAARINELAAAPARLQAMRAEAFHLAQMRFNWDVEQRRVVDLIARLERPATAGAAWRAVRT